MLSSSDCQQERARRSAKSRTQMGLCATPWRTGYRYQAPPSRTASHSSTTGQMAVSGRFDVSAWSDQCNRVVEGTPLNAQRPETMRDLVERSRPVVRGRAHQYRCRQQHAHRLKALEACAHRVACCLSQCRIDEWRPAHHDRRTRRRILPLGHKPALPCLKREKNHEQHRQRDEQPDGEPFPLPFRPPHGCAVDAVLGAGTTSSRSRSKTSPTCTTFRFRPSPML